MAGEKQLSVWFSALPPETISKEFKVDYIFRTAKEMFPTEANEAPDAGCFVVVALRSGNFFPTRRKSESCVLAN